MGEGHQCTSIFTSDESISSISMSSSSSRGSGGVGTDSSGGRGAVWGFGMKLTSVISSSPG